MEIRIEPDGRLTLPATLLRELGWSPGTRLDVERDGAVLLLRSAAPRSEGIASPHGSATPAAVDTVTLKDEARRLAAAMHGIAASAVTPLASDAADTFETPAEQVQALLQPDARAASPAPSQAAATPNTQHPTPNTTPPALLPHHGATPQVPASCFIAPGAFIAGEVKLGEECSVWPGASLRGDVNRIELGPRTNVQDGAVIHVNHGEHPAIIGAGVTIGHQAMLHGCHVEDEALIGIHAVVLDGARLGTGCMIGAGAVVPPGMEVPPGKLALGVPARIVRDLTPAELEANRANAAEYVRLRGEYLQVFGCSGVQVMGQPGDSSQYPNTPTPEHLNARTPEHPLPTYPCRRIRTPVEIDGALDEKAWAVAQPASAFVLSDGSTSPPRFPTEARLCWDEKCLYVAFSCPDSDIWGTHTQRDDPLYNEEVVEVFLCPTGNLAHYFEFEVSPRNTLFDAKVFNPELERRTMLVDHEWNAAGLRTAVRVAGTIERRDDHDIGWIVEMAIPFADLDRTGPPQPGDEWRMNLYRIERGEVEEYTAWSPTLKSPPDYHVPSRFGTIVFVEA